MLTNHLYTNPPEKKNNQRDECMRMYVDKCGFICVHMPCRQHCIYIKINYIRFLFCTRLSDFVYLCCVSVKVAHNNIYFVFVFKVRMPVYYPHIYLWVFMIYLMFAKSLRSNIRTSRNMFYYKSFVVICVYVYACELFFSRQVAHEERVLLVWLRVKKALYYTWNYSHMIR